MKYGICNISSIPIRKEPAESSEMRTELLFGEHFEIIEEIERWSRIKTSFDLYEGWIDKKIIQPLTPDEFERHNSIKPFVSGNMLNKIVNLKTGTEFYVGGGSSFPFYDSSKKIFVLGADEYSYVSDEYGLNKDIRSGLIDFAKKYINAAYLWGGRNPFGIDCSGLTQIAYKVYGFPILRDASQQVSHGVSINFIEEAKPGDLAFFDNTDGIITHVGIVMGGEKIIHASGKVRIDKLDHQGIYNEERQIYTHKLRVIKNLLG